MASFQWCLAVLLCCVAAVRKNPTTEKPIILNEDPTTEKPIILNEDPTTEKPIILNEDPTTEKPMILNEDPTTEKPIILNEDPTTEKPIILNENVVPGRYKRFLTKETEEYRHMMRDQFEMTNPTHVNGEELFESDMLLTQQQREMMAQRKATSYLSQRWTTGSDGYPYVPYVFSDSEVNQTAVQNAIAHWQQHTCIRFGVATNTNSYHLKFYNGSGCWSYVGMVIESGQQISIPSGCNGLGTVVHEIGHAMGFFHEQSRSDRDNYVHINEGNIRSGKEGNFEKENTNNYAVTYDYVSVMHYGATYFTKNGHLTIATINPLAQELIGSGNVLSHYDKLLANRMYPCITKWLSNCERSSDPCQNDGYMGADCNCVCRPGTSGTYCGTVTGNYYDTLLSDCSENVTTAGTITSPNYPSNYPSDLKCVKWIKAPSNCYTVKLKFNSFKLYGRNPYCNKQSCCYFDKLEIRTSNLYDGDIYCDAEITAGQEFTSSNGQMILYFDTTSNYYQGWSAEVSFIPSTCQTTTTSTSSSTTTSTSSSTTSTSTTTTTATTPAASVDCNEVDLGGGALQWTSPHFGQQNYISNHMCTINRTSEKPSWARIKFTKFELEEPHSNGHCWDYISFSRVYAMDDIKFCGSQTGLKLNLPTYNFDGKFLTDGSVTAAGFDVTIIPKSSKCHKLIETGGSGSTGIIKTPKKPNKIWRKKACEWWIQAPAGKRIKLTFIKMKLSSNCTDGSVLVNLDGDKSYPEADTSEHCGRAKPQPIVSTGNKMNVMFSSIKAKSNLKARWKVVDMTE